MRDHHYGCTLGIYSREEFHYAVGGLVVEVAGGLVGDDDGRSVQEGTGYGDALLLAAGELMGHLAGFILHTYVLENFFDADGTLDGILPSGSLEDEGQIVFDRAVGQQLEILEYHTHLPAQHLDLLGGDALEVEAANLAFAFEQGILGDYRPDDGGLAGADLTYYVDKISRKYRHVQILDDGRFAVVYVSSFELNEGLCAVICHYLGYFDGRSANITEICLILYALTYYS